MKSFLYLIISVVLAITLTSGVQKTSESTKSITLQASGSNVGSESLKQSADIISARLKLFGLNSFEVKVSPEKGQVKVLLPDKTDLSEIEGLLTSKGEMSFYETYTHDEISDLLKTDNQLFILLNTNMVKNDSDPRVGCSINENREKTDQYLRSSAPVKNCKFLWGFESKKSGYCLFALKTGSEGKPLMVRSDVESIKIVAGKDPQDHKIQIKLKSAASGVFADATKKNLNRVIAIVIDDQVFSWPVVRNVIEGGEIEVTGNFTANEVNCFPAIFNSDELPISFKLLK
jgi:SecD/SecF fusion protein